MKVTNRLDAAFARLVKGMKLSGVYPFFGLARMAG